MVILKGKGSSILDTIQVLGESVSQSACDLIINLVVGSHSFPPGLWLHTELQSRVSTKLYCLVTEAHVCEQLAQSYYMARSGTCNLLTVRPLYHTPHRKQQLYMVIYGCRIVFYMSGFIITWLQLMTTSSYHLLLTFILLLLHLLLLTILI